MGIKLAAKCPHCGKEGQWSQGEIDGLEDLITEERDDAASEARSEVRAEYDDDELVHPSDLTGGARPLRELAAAIRRGDKSEAEHWLDRIAEELGTVATEEVQQGRFSPLARAA